MAIYDVFYQGYPYWFPGAIQDTKTKLISDETQPLSPEDHYPDDYVGKVTGVVEPNKDGSPRGSWSSRIRMELTKEQVCQLKSRTHKIESGEIVPVTVMDRVGQRVYTELQKINPDVAKWEADEKARLEAANPEDGPPVSTFDEAVAKASEKLPQTVVNTGTGLYAVKVVPTKNDDTQLGAPAGQVITLTVGGLGVLDAFKGGYVTNVTRAETRAIVSHNDTEVTLEGSLATWVNGDDIDVYDAYATRQAAYDAVWTDQAATPFTSTQEIRNYAGTYTECVAVNAGIIPTQKYPFVDTINPGDTVILTNSGLAAHTIQFMGRFNLWLKGPLELRSELNTLSGVYTAYNSVFTNITFRHTGTQMNAYLIRICSNSRFVSCTFSATGGYAIGAMQMIQCRFLLCTFSGLAHALGGYTSDYNASAYESCLFHNITGAIMLNWAWAPTTFAIKGPRTSFVNCTFSSTFAWYWNNSAAGGRMPLVIARNCIFDAIDNLFKSPAGDDTDTEFLEMDYNCYHNVTTYLTGITTFAAWQAHTSYDGSSHDQHSFEADPLFTTPGTDFTLQLASPCRRAGAGAGVAQDITGAAFDPFHPDIGAYASDVATTPWERIKANALK